MLALKILTVLLGTAFTVFGILIFFCKKHSLINGFDEQFKAGQKTEAYARRVGLAEFIVGIVVTVVSIVLWIVC